MRRRSRNSAVDCKRKEAPGKTFTRPSRASASVDPAVEPKSRPGEAMCLRWDDRIGGPRPFPELQERSKICLGRKKVGSPLDARVVRISKSDAFRGSGPDGKGFGRQSASGRLHCRRWHLVRIGHLPWVRRWPGLERSVSPNRRDTIARSTYDAGLIEQLLFYAILNPQI